MSIERTFDLIINAGTSSPLIINANQNDSGEIWKFNLYQEDGTKVIPAAGEIVGLKSDGHAIVNAGTVNESGQVVITETAQITAAPGANVFEIVFDSVHGTANFILYVEKSPVDDDADFSKSDISAIQQAIAMAIDSATVQAIQNGLAQESATRAAQDAQLAGDISEEAATRAAADAVLRQAIDDAAIVPAGSTVVVDNTLTIAGAAADAKKTGDELGALNGALTKQTNNQTAIAGNLDQNIETKSATNNYYITMSNVLTAGKPYLVGVTVQTAGTYTIKAGTGASAGAMVDTLLDSEVFEANVTKYLVYVPSAANIKHFRCSQNTVSWSIELNEVVEIDGILNDINTLKNAQENNLHLQEQYLSPEQKEQARANIDAPSTDDVLSTVITGKTAVSLTIENGFYSRDDGSFQSDNQRRCAKVTVNQGETYSLSTHTRPATIDGLQFYSDGALTERHLKGTGTDVDINNYTFTIPTGIDEIAVQSSNTTAPILYKCTVEKELKHPKGMNGYGVRWSMSDPDDEGERVGNAKGLTATIGIGSTAGTSDFNSIYPWSEMKRCNIVINENGAKIVVYEGETGFALDGSNGDVYVRIPKFTVVREQKDGYEYRFIGVSGAPVHEAFIEDGKELDEIFVGAFEGVVINNVLHSYGGKCPTSDMSGPDYLTAAKANNPNECTLYDMRCVDALWTLMAVEFGKRNSNRIFGYGYSDYMQPAEGLNVIETASGTNNIKVATSSGNPISAASKAFMPDTSTLTICDGNSNVIAVRQIVSMTDHETYTTITLAGDPVDVVEGYYVGSGGCMTNFCESCSAPISYHTGRADYVSGSNTRNPVRYRWIENFIGSLWHNLPDVTFANKQAYMCRNMKDYEFGKYTDPYKPVGIVLPLNVDNGNKSDVVGSNYWVTELLNDTFAKSLAFGKTYDKSLTSAKAFGAYYYLNGSNGTHIVNGGGFDHLWRSNILTQRAWQTTSLKWYLYGARLIRKIF